MGVASSTPRPCPAGSDPGAEAVHEFMRVCSRSMYGGRYMEWIESFVHPDVEVFVNAPPWLGDDSSSLWRVQGREVVKALAWSTNLQGQRAAANVRCVRYGVLWAELCVDSRIVESGKTVQHVEGFAFRLRDHRARQIYRHVDWAGIIEGFREPGTEPMPESQQSVLQTPGPSWERPCLHNSWDNCRAKRCWAQLRCRVCGAQWRVPEPRPAELVVCPAFREGVCELGVACPRPHIHSKKLPIADRVPAPPPRPVPETVVAAFFTRVFTRVDRDACFNRGVWPPAEPECSSALMEQVVAVVGKLNAFEGNEQRDVDLDASAPLLLSEVRNGVAAHVEPPAPAGCTPERHDSGLAVARAFALAREQGRDEDSLKMLSDEVVFVAPHCHVRGKEAMLAAFARNARRPTNASPFVAAPAGGEYVRNLNVRLSVLTFALRQRITVKAGLITKVAMEPAITRG